MVKVNFRFYALVSILTTLLVCILYHTIGMFSEELAEIANSFAHNGIFLAEPTPVFNNSNNFTLITHTMAWLKMLLPSVNIQGMLMLAFSVVYITQYVLSCWLVLPETGQRNRFYLWLVYGLVFALLLNDLFFIQYTRVSFHLVASGLILYNLAGSKAVRALAFLAFFCGMMLRFDPFVVVAPMLCAFLVIYGVVRRWSDIVRLVRVNIPFALVYVFFVVVSDINFTPSDARYEPYRAIIYAFECYQADSSAYRFETRFDTLRYMMVENHFYNELSVKDFYEMGIKPVDRDPLSALSVFDTFRIRKGIADFREYADMHRNVLLLYLLVMLLPAVALLRQRAMRVLAGCLLTGSLILMISVYIKIEDRVSYPMLGLTALCAFLYILPSADERAPYWRYWLVLMIPLLIAGNYRINRASLGDRYAIEAQISPAANTFDSIPGLKVVFWNIEAYYLLMNREASPAELYDPNRDYSIESSLFYITDQYRKRMTDRFGTYQFKDIFMLAINDPGFVFFARPEKMDFYLKYMEYRYGVHVRASKVMDKAVYTSPLDEKPVYFYLYRVTR